MGVRPPGRSPANLVPVDFVVEALAGSSGVYALRPGRPRELVLSAPGLVGLAFSGDGALFVTSNDTLYGFGLR